MTHEDDLLNTYPEALFLPDQGQLDTESEIVLGITAAPLGPPPATSAGDEDFGDVFGNLLGNESSSWPEPKAHRQNTSADQELFVPLRNACSRHDWDAIYQLLSQPPLAGRVPPLDLRGMVEEAHARVFAREELRAAVANREPRRIVEVYECYSHYLDNWPACADLLKQVAPAKARLQRLEELEALRQAPGDGRRLVELWNRHGGELAAMPEAAAIAQTAQQWDVRLRACAHLRAVIEQPGSTERAIARAWAVLDSAGGHPDANGYRLRAEQAEARVACLDQLQALLPEESEDNDRQFHQIWDELLLQGCAEAAALRLRYGAVCRRLELVNALRKVITALPAGGDEAPILAAAARLPANYPHRLQARVEQARLRIKYRSELSHLLEASPRSDVAVAEAWEKALALGSLLLSRAVVEQCQLAVRRRDLLRVLKAIDPALPADAQDAEWLRLWDAALLDPCADAAQARKRYRLARERAAAWQILEVILDRKDLQQINAAANHPLLKNYPPLLRRKAECEELLQRVQRLEKFHQLLALGDPSAFMNDDQGKTFQFVRDNSDLFADQRARIEELVQRWLLQEVRLLAGDPPYVVAGDGSRVVVRWTWPYFGRVTHCRVAVHPSRFFATPEEAFRKGKIGTSRLNAEDHRRGGGLTIPLVPGQPATVCVTVWPVVDLGWKELLGQPLKVGPVSARRAR